MKTSNTRKKATTARTKPAAVRSKAKRTTSGKPTGLSAAELIQTADQLGLKLYATEGLTNFRQRAMTSLKRIEAAGMTYDGLQPEDWILLAQEVREKGGMSSDEIFAGIDNNVDEIVYDDPEIQRLSAAIDAKYKEYGAKDDECWPDGEAPEDMEVLRTAFDDRRFQLRIAVLRHHGEDEMAALLESDPDAYEAIVERGREATMKRQAARTADGIPGQAK